MTSYLRPPKIRASDLQPGWHVIDADGRTLGRVATEVAVILQGKHKANFVQNINTGDYVIVINAQKVRVTGKKLDQKKYYRHSGYIGGLKEQTLGEVMEKMPTKALSQAIKGMLPKNSIGRKMFSRLKVYADSIHPHEAQLNSGAKIAKALEKRASEAKPKKSASVRSGKKNSPKKSENGTDMNLTGSQIEDVGAPKSQEILVEQKPKAKPKKSKSTAKPKSSNRTKSKKPKSNPGTTSKNEEPQQEVKEEEIS